MIAPVTEIEAGDDRYWFVDNPARRFRWRPSPDGRWWIVWRHSRDVLLRTRSGHRPLPYSTDKDLAALWYQAAYPDWPLDRCRKQARKVIKRRPA